jgi:23S rRNA (cytosine1962-C5)-methyltransferase
VQPGTFAPVPLACHQLLDSGGAEKLERFGEVVLRRPDPQALWSPRLASREWERADLVFVRETDRGGRWEPRPGSRARAEWTVRHDAATFLVRPTPFKHVGLFPEQAPNWELVSALRPRFDGERPRLLNLFGYTGAASVLAAQAGYDVTHVDASKTSLAWARDNVAASGLVADSLRVILDDALAFARREARRGARYAVILMDPPHYGRGPKGEKWQFEDDVAALVAAVREIAAERALVVLSSYAIGTSPLALANLLAEIGAGSVEAGELALAEADGARALPAGFCARWRRGLDDAAL